MRIVAALYDLDSGMPVWACSKVSAAGSRIHGIASWCLVCRDCVLGGTRLYDMSAHGPQ